MATLAEIARQRRRDLAALKKQSRQLDAVQETFEREVNRLQSRKTLVPEAADAERLINLLIPVEDQRTKLVDMLTTLAKSWTTV